MAIKIKPEYWSALAGVLVRRTDDEGKMMKRKKTNSVFIHEQHFVFG